MVSSSELVTKDPNEVQVWNSGRDNAGGIRDILWPWHMLGISLESSDIFGEYSTNLYNRQAFFQSHSAEMSEQPAMILMHQRPVVLSFRQPRQPRQRVCLAWMSSFSTSLRQLCDEMTLAQHIVM